MFQTTLRKGLSIQQSHRSFCKDIIIFHKSHLLALHDFLFINPVFSLTFKEDIKAWLSTTLTCSLNEIRHFFLVVTVDFNKQMEFFLLQFACSTELQP